jgi:predicted dehydrogenase
MHTILIVGYGSIGKRHFKNISKSTNAKIIVLTKQKNLRELQKNNIVVTNSLKKALSYKPDIGFVTNETSLHVNTALTLAENNMHLFLEKPLSHSMKNVLRLKNQIKKKKLISQIGCHMRFHPCIKKIKNILENDTLGRIISIDIESSSFLPDWHPYEDYRLGYAARDELGGGISLTCIHEIDLLYWFFGKPKKVFSITGKFSDLDVKSDDLSVMTFLLKNRIIGEIHLDYFQRPEFKSCKIKGVKGTLYWDSPTNEIKIFKHRTKKWKSILKIKNFKKNSMYIDEIKYFFNAVKQKEKTMNDITDGINTLQIVLDAKRSSKLEKLVSIK